jgi:quercetin dioxygenase-like cupin family protein
VNAMTQRETRGVSKPATIYNAVQRDRVTFLGTRSDTQGEYSLHRLELEPGGGNTAHRHAAYSESFLVLSGELYLQINGKLRVLKVGERASVAVGVPHRFFAEIEAVKFDVEIRPPHREEFLLRGLYGLANDGLTDARGMPKDPRHTALLAHAAATYPARGPLWLHRAVLGVLATIARWQGKDRDFDKYL